MSSISRPSPCASRLACLTLGLCCALAARADVLEETRVALGSMLAGEATRLRLADVDILGLRLLRRIYGARDHAPLWTEAARLALVELVANSAHDGLQPRDYPLWTRPLVADLTPPERAMADIVLTESLTRLAYSLRFGKANPVALDPGWNYARMLGPLDPVAWITTAITSADLAAALMSLRPATLYYAALVAALNVERDNAGRGAWPGVSTGPSLKPGTSDARVRELRARLVASGDLLPAATGDQDYFDEALRAAVLSFQARRGLAIDGVAGRATVAALNVPAAARIAALRVNLERIRWVFQDLEDEYLAINIAAFYAAYVRHGTIAWRARVVVGRPYRQTPIFKSRITHFELNPSWTVPPTILAHDILPRVREDPRYLATKKLEVLDREGRAIDPTTVHWQDLRARDFPYVLRQPPGDDNALGRIKFLFPNPYAVYLHDTPARELFAQAARGFSSGCIRIERPLELAQLLLNDDPAWSPAAVAGALARGTRQRVNLRKPIPILLLYLTAFPDERGQVQFRPDLYARDPPVLDALDGPFAFSPPTDYLGDPPAVR